ncbi:MAG: DUF3617 family protein [Casimicrobiaceae bacterium]
MNSVINNRGRTTLLRAVVAFSAVVATAAGAEVRIRAGLWESTTTRGGQQINSATRCITPEVAAKSNLDQAATKADLVSAWARANCTMKDIATTASTLVYSVDCGTSANPHTLSSTSTFHGDAFETEMIYTSKELTTDTITQGRRIGSCP